MTKLVLLNLDSSYRLIIGPLVSDDAQKRGTMACRQATFSLTLEEVDSSGINMQNGNG
jgi:hypothetical protein